MCDTAKNPVEQRASTKEITKELIHEFAQLNLTIVKMGRQDPATLRELRENALFLVQLTNGYYR